MNASFYHAITNIMLYFFCFLFQRLLEPRTSQYSLQRVTTGIKIRPDESSASIPSHGKSLGNLVLRWQCFHSIVF